LEQKIHRNLALLCPVRTCGKIVQYLIRLFILFATQQKLRVTEPCLAAVHSVRRQLDLHIAKCISLFEKLPFFSRRRSFKRCSTTLDQKIFAVGSNFGKNFNCTLIHLFGCQQSSRLHKHQRPVGGGWEEFCVTLRRFRRQPDIIIGAYGKETADDFALFILI
jgi:hypothetical protein